MTSDGEPQYISAELQTFLETWVIAHRLSSAYNPHGNTRAELGVKSTKRMIQATLGPGGTLDNNKFSRAMLAYRNTPDQDTNRSQAQVLFGRHVRDFIPVHASKYQQRQDWLLTQDDRKRALRRRHLQSRGRR